MASSMISIEISNKPTVNDLDLCLTSVVFSWKRFGLRLPAITQTELDTIEVNKPGDVVAQKLELYKVWLKLYPNASWGNVIKALEEVGENTIAKQLRQKMMFGSMGVVSANTSNTRLNTIRRHYSDLTSAIADGPSSPDLLLSVSNRFYQNDFIDLQMKVDINRSGGLTGASMLLDHIMMKMEQSDCYLPLVMDILREEVVLTDIVHKMEESAAVNQGSASLTDTTIALSTGSPHNPMRTLSHDTTVTDTISAAERLKSAFESLCFVLMMAISRAQVNLAWLRLQISLRLQHTRGNTPPEVQKHLRELDDCTKAESVLTFLIDRNILGYLNFDLFEAFKPVLSSDEFNKKLEEYHLAHKQFIMNNFHNIVEAFRQNENIRPVSIIGLPKIKVELATPWKSRSLYYWKELVKNNVDWDQHIMITRVEFNCISITYQVLPFIIPKVVKDLTNETIVKQFTAIGATFTIPDELVQDGIADNQWIMDIVHEHILLKKTRSSKENDPVVNNLNEPTDQPLEEVSPKLPLKPSRPVSITGGYDDELFLSPPPGDLQCPVCRFTVREPHQLTCCGVLLCQVCSDSTSASIQCPYCRDTNHQIMADTNARRRVMSLQVKCTVPGCHWIGELLDLQTHLGTGGYDASIFPVWCHQKQSSLHYGVLPVYRTIKDFNKHKQNNAELYTDPFYTSDGGYRATLAVYPNGYGSGKGTHVSVFINLMRGPNDDNLEFPITGIFTAQVLNWKGSTSHYIERGISFDDGIPIKFRRRVVTGEKALGQGYAFFLPHDNLIRYLHHDMMCFKIGFYPVRHNIAGCSLVPSWYDVMYSTSATPPCTRTLYSYYVYKKTNSEWYSRPFYSSDKGYKLQLKAVANGETDGKTSLSLSVFLMKGEYDKALPWPLKATIAVQLLNWSFDRYHSEKTIHHYEASFKARQRVYKGTRAPSGVGSTQFISHSNLEYSDPVRFINDNDAICFRIGHVGIIK